MIPIGRLQVHLSTRELLLDGRPIRIGCRAFDILEMLIRANGAMVSKQQIFQQVWPDTIVEENNLQVHISKLRKLLGDDRDLIKTVAGRGYRLTLVNSNVSAGQMVPHGGAGEQRPTGNNNLPARNLALIGRNQAIEQISQALQASRHVTLLGAGGIGKTQLGLEVARHLLPHFPDGVYLIGLSTASDARAVLAEFAQAIGARTADDTVTLAQQIKLLGHWQALFLLDNCEHVLPGATELADALMQWMPQARILATSREALRVSDEALYWVEPLTLPSKDDTIKAVLRCSAVQLFLARARAMDQNFPLDAMSIALTATVCRRLDGIPLAIELAAARATTLGIKTLAAHLDDRFRTLTGGHRSALPRHQTLKATLDWSYKLLDDAQRTVVRRLGIFANSFTLEAAIAVTSDADLSGFEVMEAVRSLVEKSLLMSSVHDTGQRFHLLETTRAYALQQLDDNGEYRLMAARYARYLHNLIEGGVEKSRCLSLSGVIFSC